MPKVKDVICQNISITSDEQIKAGDYVYIIGKNLLLGKKGEIIKINSTREGHTDYTRMNGTKGWFASDVNYQKDWHYKKVILNTDVDLIKDGVEPITDEFLIWFVKNSNCEFVEIEMYHGIKTSIAEVNAVSGDNSMNWKGRGDLRDYKIIIPKIVIAPETIKETSEIEKLAIDLLKDKWQHLYAFGYPKHPFPTNYENDLNKVKLGIYEGQKLQSKKLYCENEVLTMLEDYDRMFKLDTFAYTQACKYTVKEWFDKNKKQH